MRQYGVGMGMQLERYYEEMEERYAADHPVASRWSGASDLVVISPEMERRRLLAWSAPDWLRQLTWNTLPVVLGSIIAAVVLGLAALIWRHAL
jgi:hypothetical protein